MPGLEPWQKIVAEKRSLREQALQPYFVDGIHLRPERVASVADRSRIEPREAQSITEIDSVEQLHGRLCRGELTATDVTLAYIKRLDSSYTGSSLSPLH
ncbi:uncharacterized protein PADG_12054 [Paracoccidioides brasiliensis Pb18]|uniref:Uncharacterized protein n=1 Tax=Paracoccidioides brasiliensis (strain Pb18) TaxID=502780 RepID=A0A0A0HRF5_PARBD|nr:uncharacterized protein PADG_12054 [Paracoccidioides brasiliensis Pb18]KGM91749.1 hypothetical protein PADG_12054 [Paracoccidioides brasiliensis Pb18]